MLYFVIDRRYAAFGGQDSLVSIWDLEELYCVRTINRSTDGIRALGFSFDSNYLAFGCYLSGRPVLDIVSKTY